MKSVFKYLFLPIAASVVGCLLLLLVSFIPNAAIEANSIKSASEILSQGDFPALINSQEDFTVYLDNYTDQLIMMESYTLSSENLDSILLNPYYMPDEGSSVGAFSDLLSKGVETNIDYVRYWQGFRVFIRPLLVFASYFQILEFSAIAFFLLFSLSVIFVAQKHGAFLAMLLALAIAFFRPAVIAFSLQYVCCFILMFVFSSIVVKLNIAPAKAPFIFALFGIATQFFDFYTTPLITYAIPVLLLLLCKEYSSCRWLTLIKTAAAWAYGYVSMWIVKLAATTLFTDTNGFADGFSSLSRRLNISSAQSSTQLNDIISALKNAWWFSCPGDNELLVFISLVFVVVISAAVLLKRQGFRSLLSCSSLLAVATSSLLWVIACPQAMNIHAWFQHRTMLPFYVGIFFFAYLSFKEFLACNKCKTI